MTFPTPPGHHRLPMGQGFAAQPCGLAEQQGVAYAKTVAEAMKLKLDADNPADREKLREQFSILWPGEKCESKKGMVEILWFSCWQAFCSAIHLRLRN